MKGQKSRIEDASPQDQDGSSRKIQISVKSNIDIGKFWYLLGGLAFIVFQRYGQSKYQNIICKKKHKMATRGLHMLPSNFLDQHSKVAYFHDQIGECNIWAMCTSKWAS